MNRPDRVRTLRMLVARLRIKIESETLASLTPPQRHPLRAVLLEAGKALLHRSDDPAAIAAQIERVETALAAGGRPTRSKHGGNAC